jgi:hypothetical protein
VIDLVQQSFYESISNPHGPIHERLKQAFRTVDSELRIRFPMGTPEDAVDPSATLLVAVIFAGTASLAWIGRQQAKLFRGGRCTNETTPDTGVIDSRRDGTCRKVVFPMRSLPFDPRSPPDEPACAGPWGLENGDVMVIADQQLFLAAPNDEVAKLLNESFSPAEELVQWAQAAYNDFIQSAIVIRIGGNSGK